jgi:uncharacterized protein (UPF0276 family)
MADFRKREASHKRFKVPYLGFGAGLRPVHFSDFLETKPQVDWLEVISENFMVDGGRPFYFLDQIRELYSMVPHGVSLSIGSADPLDWDYLNRLKALVKRLDPPWFSDHLCWTGVHGKNLHNLMPLPYTSEVADYIGERARIIQEFMEIPFLLENVSSYMEFKESTMTEWDFLTRIVEKADCGILLDINNVYVSSFNHQFDPMTFLKGIPADRVIQYHIAGHNDKGHYILDTHDHEVRDEVWALYQQAAPMFGDVSLMLERDDDIPPLEEMLKELDYAKAIQTNLAAKI